MSRSKNMSRNRDCARIMQAAIALGCKVTRTSGGHVKITTPSGRFIITGFSPSDHRAAPNLRAELRKAGVAV